MQNYKLPATIIFTEAPYHNLPPKQRTSSSFSWFISYKINCNLSNLNIENSPGKQIVCGDIILSPMGFDYFGYLAITSQSFHYQNFFFDFLQGVHCIYTR